MAQITVVYWNEIDAMVPALQPGTLNAVTATNPATGRPGEYRPLSSASLLPGFLADFLDVPQGDAFHRPSRASSAPASPPAAAAASTAAMAGPRDQMAVFLLKAEHGVGLPPAPLRRYLRRRALPVHLRRLDRAARRRRHHRRLRRRQLLSGQSRPPRPDGRLSAEGRARIRLRAAAAATASSRTSRALRRSPTGSSSSPRKDHGGLRRRKLLPGHTNTRGQMAVFLVKTFSCPSGGTGRAPSGRIPGSMRYQSLRPRLDPLLPTVEKPGRYIGLERNVTRKDLSKATATLALAFPDTYEIGMSHTGLKILYELVNRREEYVCERVYAPWVDLEAKMREASIPLFSTESFAPVGDFDVLGFSLQAELNYSNILNMLDLAGLPVWQRERRESDPIVLGGGPCTANCEPIADFFDAFLVGDAEDALTIFLDAYCDGRARGLSRRELLVHLAADRGHLRAVALRRDVRRERPHHGDHAERPARAEAGQAHLGAGAEARVLPRQAHGPLGRDRAGPPRPRGHARLHAGLPLLPGRLLVPPRARARSGRRGGHDEEVHRRVGLERSRASSRSRPPTTRRSSHS